MTSFARGVEGIFVIAIGIFIMILIMNLTATQLLTVANVIISNSSSIAQNEFGIANSVNISSISNTPANELIIGYQQNSTAAFFNSVNAVFSLFPIIIVFIVLAMAIGMFLSMKGGWGSKGETFSEGFENEVKNMWEVGRVAEKEIKKEFFSPHKDEKPKDYKITKMPKSSEAEERYDLEDYDEF